MNKQQKWLTQEAQMSKVYLCSIMNGHVVPKLTMLRRIAGPLGMDPFNLLAALFDEES